jgi:MFS family permease
MFAFAIGTMSDSMEGGLINTLFPVIAKALALDVGALGVLSSVSKWARMLFGTMWAILGDKFGRKKIMVLMTGFWGLWTAAAGLAQNFN